MPPEDIRALVNQGLCPEDMGLRTTASVVADEDDPMNNGLAPRPPNAAPTFLLFDDQPLSPISIGTTSNQATANSVEPTPLLKAGSKRKADPEASSSGASTATTSAFVPTNTVALTHAVPIAGNGYPAEDGVAATASTSQASASSLFTAIGDKRDNISTASSSNSSKKIRRVQTKVKFAPTTSSSKTRNK